MFQQMQAQDAQMIFRTGDPHLGVLKIH